MPPTDRYRDPRPLGKGAHDPGHPRPAAAGRRLPAPTRAWTLATLRDDPLEPVAIQHHPPPPARVGGLSGSKRMWAIIATSGLALALASTAMGTAVLLPGLLVLAVAMGVGGKTTGGLGRSSGRGARPGVPALSPSGRPARALGPTHTADQIAIDLQPPKTLPIYGFDPFDPRHRDAAELIHTCRARDGLGFAAPSSAHRSGALLASIEPFGMTVDTLEERLDQWARVADFIERYAHPEAVWLAAVACREETSARRAAAALRRLAAMPGQRVQLDRVLLFIDAEGHWCARGAVAILRADAEALSHRIAEAPAEQIPSLTHLIEARWQADPDPALFAAWAAQTDPGLALIAAELPGAGEARWRALSSHGAPELAGQAVGVMLSEDPPLPLLGDRALLTRPDIQRLCADGPPPQALRDGVTAAMEHLARAGAADDLRLLGQWGRDPRLGDQARQSHQTLKSWLGADALGGAGGLALAADEGASGGLSPADGGGPSPTEPEPR